MYLDDEELREIFVGLDTDGNRQVDWSEFVTACLGEEYARQREYAWASFRVFDMRKQGFIAPRDLEEVLGCSEVRDTCGTQVVADIVAEVAEDRKVSWPIFQSMMAQDIRPRLYQRPKTHLAAVFEYECEDEVDADDPPRGCSREVLLL